MTTRLDESTRVMLLLVTLVACNSGSKTGDDGGGVAAGDAADVRVAESARITVDVSNARPISPMLYGQNYYNWVPGWGGQVLAIKDLVVPLHLNLLRMGGTPADTSDPVMFDFDQLDTFISYAAEVGAKPLLQIPFVALRDTTGTVAPASSYNAAEIVRYANVTHNYGLRYVSIGNEPDLYEEQGQKLNGQSAANYTAERFCTSFAEYVAAMKAVDPSLRIVGPELSWKYRAGNDWLSPFLRNCGALVDVATVHLYPFSSTQDTAEAVLENATAFRATIRDIRQLMREAGYGDKPFGITETHVTWDSDPAKPQLSGAPGSTAAGLWVADVLGVAMEEDLWTLSFWSLSESWTLGFIDGRTPKPEYYALMMVAAHFRSRIGNVKGAPAGVSVYAGRNDTSTPVLFINKTAERQDLTVAVVGTPIKLADVSITIPPLSLVVMEIPDAGEASAWVYGDAQHGRGIGPQAFIPGSEPLPATDAAVADSAVDGGTVTCPGEVPVAEGRLDVANGLVSVASLHGYASAWSWVGDTSAATVCVRPDCTAPHSLEIAPIAEEGAAPLTSDAVTCAPAFAPSALCMAGSVSKDPTYLSSAGLGFNLRQDSVADAGASADLGGITIPTSVAITVQKFGASTGNASLRVQLTDENGHYFCALEGKWSSGQPIPITQFNSKCWNDKGTFATATTSFKRLDILVPSAAAVDREFSFCMTDVAVK